MMQTKQQTKIQTSKNGRDEGLIQKKDSKGNLVWYARIVRTMPDGSKKQYTRKGDDKTHARKMLRELEDKFEDYGNKGIEGEKLTFGKLAAIYEKRHLVEAKFIDHSDGRRKISGLKNTTEPKRFLETLVSHLGNIRLKEFTHSDIENFKHQRLEKPVIHEKIIRRKDAKTKLITTETIKTEKPRKISGVNRELEQLRAVLRFAVRQGWLSRSPFDTGKPVISKADENRRERVLSYDEERRLLAACDETKTTYERSGKQIESEISSDAIKRRQTLKVIIITALDTAMRKGEIIKLTWQDVDLTAGIIRVKAANSKTERPRTVPMTPRLKAKLTKLFEKQKPDFDQKVFGVSDNVKRSFATACDAAGISDFRFHDCRHTAVTRMIAAGIPAEETMKISGHSQITTFLRYLNPTNDSLSRAAEKLANFNLDNQMAVEVASEAIN
jgi:integrase